MFEVYSDEHGAPESITINDTTLNYSYNPSINLVSFDNKLTTLCAMKIAVIWK